MNPMIMIALITMLKEAVLLFMDLSGKTEIKKEDLVTKSPEDILAELGISLEADPDAPSKS